MEIETLLQALLGGNIGSKAPCNCGSSPSNTTVVEFRAAYSGSIESAVNVGVSRSMQLDLSKIEIGEGGVALGLNDLHAAEAIIRKHQDQFLAGC